MKKLIFLTLMIVSGVIFCQSQPSDGKAIEIDNIIEINVISSNDSRNESFIKMIKEKSTVRCISNSSSQEASPLNGNQNEISGAINVNYDCNVDKKTQDKGMYKYSYKGVNQKASLLPHIEKISKSYRDYEDILSKVYSRIMLYDSEISISNPINNIPTSQGEKITVDSKNIVYNLFDSGLDIDINFSTQLENLQATPSSGVSTYEIKATFNSVANNKTKSNGNNTNEKDTIDSLKIKGEATFVAIKFPNSNDYKIGQYTDSVTMEVTFFDGIKIKVTSVEKYIEPKDNATKGSK